MKVCAYYFQLSSPFLSFPILALLRSQYYHFRSTTASKVKLFEVKTKGVLIHDDM
jgi:hypothetical protein